MKCFFVVLLVSLCVGDLISLETPIGVFQTEESEESLSFKGIPYAKSIDQSWRWRRSELSDQFDRAERMFDCTEFGSLCPQRQERSFPSLPLPMSEDCLYLNVWTPRRVIEANKLISPSPKLAVIIYIHGGGFALGSGADLFVDGHEFNRNDVILVSFNYRLGVLGFYSDSNLMEDDEGMESLNIGLYDQRVAFSWVIKHIEHFGGDPTRISIFGESAGAMSVAWHLAGNEEHLPKEERIYGKIKGAIMQSVPDLPYSTCEEYIGDVQQCNFLEGFCENVTSTDYLSCLRDIPALEMANKVSVFGSYRKFFWHTNDPHGKRFMMTACSAKGTVFDKQPREAFKEGNFNTQIPVIIGATRHEMLIFIQSAFPEYNLMDWNHYAGFVTAGFGENATHIIKRYKQYENDFHSYSYLLSELTSDLYFHCGSQMFADSISRYQDRTYRYSFEIEPEYALSHLKSFHVSEMPFIFVKPVEEPSFLSSKFTEEEEKIAKKMNFYWSYFAKNSGKLPEEWIRYEEDYPSVMMFDTPDISVEDEYRVDICKFWRKLYPDGTPYLGFREYEFTHESWKSFIFNILPSKVGGAKNLRWVLTGTLVGVIGFLYVSVLLLNKLFEKEKEE